MRYSLEEQSLDLIYGGLKFVEIKKLSEEEYIEIDNEIKVIDLFFHIEDYFEITTKNFEEVMNYIKQEYNKVDENGLETFLNENFLRAVRIEVNRLLLNYLSSSRTFTDHISRILKNKEFEYFISKIYDSNFSYRFCSRLRNYAQHSGLPLTYFGVKVNALQTKQLCFMFDIAHLLSDFNGWSSVKTDLEEFGERKLDCKVVISKYQENLNQILNFTLKLQNAKLGFAISYLKNILEKHNSSNDLVIVMRENDYSTKTRLISRIKIETIEKKL